MVSSRFRWFQRRPKSITNMNAAKLVLAELHYLLDTQIRALAELDSKAANLLQWSSLAVSVTTAISVRDLLIRSRSPQYILGIELPAHFAPVIVFVICLVLYIALVLICLRIISPAEYALPVSSDWNNLYQKYMEPGEYIAVEQLVIQHLAVIKINADQIEDKAHWIGRGFQLLPILIGFLVLLIAHPLWEAWLL